MTKREQLHNNTSDFEQGINEVSQQIMDSYNSGVISQDEMKSAMEREEGQR